MAITYEQFNIPFAPVNDNPNIGGEHKSYWPLPTRHHRLADYHFVARKYHDVVWEGGVPPSGKYVYYFHGSGGSWLNSNNDGFIKTLVNAGICVITPMFFSTEQSSKTPYRYGYGNVNAPHFMSHFIKTGLWVDAAYRHALTLPANSKFVFLGHSMGAAAALTWAANFSTGPVHTTLAPGFKGIITNGATVGGLGNFTWNDLVRNLSTLSQIVSRLRHDIKAIILYADNDAYAPPDYARRLEMVAGRSGFSRPQYFLSPGNYGHSWYNLRPDLVLMWCNQLLNDATITQRDGITPAVSVA